MNRREGGGNQPSTPTKPMDNIDMKEENIVPFRPKQFQHKLIPTPRIKLKHNDISDEEFSLLMEHQRRVEYVNVLNYSECTLQYLLF